LAWYSDAYFQGLNIGKKASLKIPVLDQLGNHIVRYIG